jgi:hypothetical protein
MFRVYREPGDMEARIKAALTAEYESQGRMPQVMVVPKVEFVAARDAVERLEISQVDIVGCGGCLVPEVWLGGRRQGDGRNTE